VKSETQNPEQLPLSLLNDLLYCPRRAALKLIEGWRDANEHTARGDIVHEHADLPGYEVAKGVTLLRALPVFSERLGLSGKCDIVEAEFANARAAPVTGLKLEVSDVKSLAPVEFKLGKRRQWENDDAQLCAQAICLEEMFGIPISRGAIFHASSKRRREVQFTAELRATTEAAIAQLHSFQAQFDSATPDPEIRNPRMPAAVFKPACEECSLFLTCLPRATCANSRARRLAGQLFEI
jgi:CRISPR-associated exonuclease Cas4